MRKIRASLPRILVALILISLAILAVIHGHSSSSSYKNKNAQKSNSKIAAIVDGNQNENAIVDGNQNENAIVEAEYSNVDKGVVVDEELQLQEIRSISTNEITTEKSKGVQCPSNAWTEGLPTIYIITPTYRRAEQIAELTRTAQTLLHVKNLFWIVVEDAAKPTPEVIEYLAGSGVKNVYLRAEMPKQFLKVKNKPRGVANRNAGIEWVRRSAKEGVVFFGDDDNSYDLRIFEEIRTTKVVSMFPVGLVTKLGVSSPIIRNGRVIGFYDGWISGRKFPVDMAGFAINVDLFLKNPKALMPFKVGYEEDELLKSLNVNVASIEPKAHNCTKIWVWHTQTKKNPAVANTKLKVNFNDTNLVYLQKLLWRGV